MRGLEDLDIPAATALLRGKVAKALRITLFLAKKHQNTAVRRPGWPLNQKTSCQQTFATAVWPHHTDMKRAPENLGEGDEITPW